MESHTERDGSKEALIVAIVVISLLIDAPILIYPPFLKNVSQAKGG